MANVDDNHCSSFAEMPAKSFHAGKFQHVYKRGECPGNLLLDERQNHRNVSAFKLSFIYSTIYVLWYVFACAFRSACLPLIYLIYSHSISSLPFISHNRFRHVICGLNDSTKDTSQRAGRIHMIHHIFRSASTELLRKVKCIFAYYYYDLFCVEQPVVQRRKDAIKRFWYTHGALVHTNNSRKRRKSRGKWKLRCAL